MVLWRLATRPSPSLLSLRILLFVRALGYKIDIPLFLRTDRDLLLPKQITFSSIGIIKCRARHMYPNGTYDPCLCVLARRLQARTTQQ